MQNEVYTDYEGLENYPSDETTQDVNTNIYNFVFHFNAYTGLWSAIPCNSYNDYWSNVSNDNILRSKSIDTLLHLLNKTGGDIQEVHKITSGQ